MLSVATEEQQDFKTWLLLCYQELVQDKALGKVRAKAWDHFLELGLPDRSTEVYRYVRPNRLIKQQFLSSDTDVTAEQVAAHTLPECHGALLVFANGRFLPELSQKEALGKVVVAPLSKAVRTYGAFLNNRWAKALKEETDPFAVLNAALHPEGAFLYVPPRVAVETPVQLLNIVSGETAPLAAMPRLQLFVGAGSELSIVSTSTVAAEEIIWCNQVTDVALEEDAHCRITLADDILPTKVWLTHAVRAQLKRNSHFHAFHATRGSAMVRHDYHVVIGGEHAEVFLGGLALLDGRNEAHTNVLIDHQEPHCSSNQLFKTALTDSSRSSFEGKILVRQAAQKTDAFQLNNNLLLSDSAHADSKPNLEIFADDVKASHGATVGQLDQEQLFYLRTRGFSERHAKSLLVHAYWDELLESITIPSLRARVAEHAQNFMAGEE